MTPASAHRVGALALVMVAGCTSLPPVTLDGNANGKRVELARGQELVLSLEENPTTGFRWEVVQNAAAVMELLGEGQYAATPTGRVGSGGTTTWRFKAAQTGSDTLRLVYRRSWEKDQPPAETFSCTVHVR